MKSHKNLTVYKTSIQFVTDIYKLTEGFPKTEIYGITNQIRRCAVSIPSNIAEGAARNYSKEKIQFYHYALGSASELDAQIEISLHLNFLNESDYTRINRQLDSVSKMLMGLLKYEKAKLNDKK